LLREFLFNSWPAGIEREGIDLLSDAPIAEEALDYFGFASFASALAGIIDNERTATPLTIALSAPWGAGKTSVAQLIEGQLRRRVGARGGGQKRVVCWFNAWEHSDAPHLGAALAAQVARTANSERSLWRRLVSPLPAAMVGPRERGRRVALLALAAAATAAAAVAFDPTRKVALNALDPKHVLTGLGGLLGLLLVGVLLWRVLFAAARDAARFVDDPRSEAARGSMKDVKDQLGALVQQAADIEQGGRLVIFIDDLERCPPPRAVQVFEVASQLLAHQGVVTVLLADMDSLAQAARAAYAGAGPEAGPADLGRRYLEKLVQLELELPAPSVSDVKLLLSEATPALEPRARPPQQTRARLLDPEPLSVGSGLGGFVGFSAGIAVTALQGGSALEASLAGLGLAGILAAVGLLAAWLYAAARRYPLIVVERRVKEAVRVRPELLRGKPDAIDAVISELARGPRFVSLAEQVVDELRTVRSEEVKEVEGFIRRYPPRFPRSAKRMLNHARLLTKIAIERRMFGPDEEGVVLTPKHLGKWIAIRERWPEFAALVAEQPAEIREFEMLPAERGPMKFPVEWPTTHSPAAKDSLIDLVRAEPRLADVLERLVYFEPAARLSEADAEPQPVAS
jgi:KAP family P-loop domain